MLTTLLVVVVLAALLVFGYLIWLAFFDNSIMFDDDGYDWDDTNREPEQADGEGTQ